MACLRNFAALMLLPLVSTLAGCAAIGSESEPGPAATVSAGSVSANTANDPAFVLTDDASLEGLDDILFTELQAFRTTQGLATIKREIRLDAAAQALADVMARKNDLSHKADGQRAGDRIAAAGYTFCTYGAPWAENIARSTTFGTTADVAEIIMTGWVNSPSHRRNMVGAFAEVGLAAAATRDGGRIYAAQVFATPGPGPCL